MRLWERKVIRYGYLVERRMRMGRTLFREDFAGGIDLGRSGFGTLLLDFLHSILSPVGFGVGPTVFWP